MRAPRRWRPCDAHAATDVTGFRLAGHLHEMLEASDASAELVWDDLPLFKGCLPVFRRGLPPCQDVRHYRLGARLRRQGGLEDEEFENRMGVLCDPQTSGGLLVAVAPTRPTRSRARSRRPPVARPR